MGLISKRVIDIVSENATKTKNARAVRRLMNDINITDEDLESLAHIMAEIKNIQEIYYLLFEKTLPANALNILMKVIIPSVSQNNLEEILSDKKFASNLSDMSAENVQLFMDRAIKHDNATLKRLIRKNLPHVPESFDRQSVDSLIKSGDLGKLQENLENKKFTPKEYSQVVEYLLQTANSNDNYLLSKCLESCLYKDSLSFEKKMEILSYFASINYDYDIEHYFNSIKSIEKYKRRYLEQLFKSGNIKMLLIFSKVVELSGDDIIKLVDVVTKSNCQDYATSIKRIMLMEGLPEQCLAKCVDWMKEYGDADTICNYLIEVDSVLHKNRTKPSNEQFIALFNVLAQTAVATSSLINLLRETEQLDYEISEEMVDTLINNTISAHKQKRVGLDKIASMSYYKKLTSKQKNKLIKYVVSNLVENANSTFSGLAIIDYDRGGDFHQLLNFAKDYSNILTINEKQKIAKVLLYDWKLGCIYVDDYLLEESVNYSEEFLEELTSTAVCALDDHSYDEYMELLPKLQKKSCKNESNV